MDILKNIPECNIFYPTIDEFKDFQKFANNCEKLATSGIIKARIF